MSILNRIFGKNKSVKKENPRPTAKKVAPDNKTRRSKGLVAKKAATFIAKSSSKKKA